MKITKSDAAIAASVATAFVTFQPSLSDAKQIDHITAPLTNNEANEHKLLQITPKQDSVIIKEIGILTKAAPREAINGMIQLAAKRKIKVKVRGGPGWAEYHEGNTTYTLP